MKFFFHFAVIGFSNTYLLGPDSGGDAILIDPGIMDIELLKLIEDNNYYAKHILVTHSHNAHVQGVKTLQKIYNSVIYSAAPLIHGFKTELISGGDILNLAGFQVEAIDVPGHSTDSVVYKTANMLFTGDVLGAGLLGSAPNEYARSTLIDSIKKKIVPIKGHYYLFPGHGPPSTLKAEKELNPFLKENPLLLNS